MEVRTHADLHGSNRSRDFESILRVVVKDDEELRGGLIRKGFAHLLGDPVAGRMSRDVAVQNATTVMADDEEAVEHLNVSVGTVKKSIAAMASR